MKFVIFVSFIAACVADSYSDLSIQAVDWPVVCRKIEEIADIIADANQKIHLIAYNDNPAVGDSISDQLEAALDKVRYLVEEAKAKCEGQILTLADAQEFFGQLKDILTGVQQDLQDELAQLSSSAASSIRDIFYSAYAQAELKAQQVYALLSQ